MKFLLYIFAMFMLLSCAKKEPVDMIIHNGNIHVMNQSLDTVDALAIKNGRIVAIGSNINILKKYTSSQVIDAKQREIYPGLHDCHAHLLSLARQEMTVDLRGTRSYYELIARLEKYQTKAQRDIIIGRGWDHTLWGETEFPDNDRLNESYPTTPVALTRIDGHAMLINKAMMDYLGITNHSKIKGGVYLKKKGKLTGILLDNAVDEVNKKLPKPNKALLAKKFYEVQELLLAHGITTIHDAGLDDEARDFFIELANQKKLKINIYAMLFPTQGNIEFAKQHGHYVNGHLTIRSFKMIADGALGSRGACLIEPYSDDIHNHGLMVSSYEELLSNFEIAKQLNYQMNTHCIGDSANRVVLQLVDSLMRGVQDHRWRIEHAQVVHPDDVKYFRSSGLIPSVQPTHATSDQRWAEIRLGRQRMLSEAYLYKSLLDTRGMILFGTDFPIENYDPFLTIFAATARKNSDNEPAEGFMPKESISLEKTMLAMTAWAAYGCFTEKESGTLEVGKTATFVILNYPLANFKEFHKNSSWMTFIDGQIVFKRQL